ncbi:uncharacterized protein LOC111069284 [Drosophila obscura]|uniref:uncharacterized protein LOC111069284 n=1 Tax=Drosophila obscura TaxID=7282 RepID=UPI000B9FA3CD|nr:uncharacterized protein LOC111069284 [Drosophila obscura]
MLTRLMEYGKRAFPMFTNKDSKMTDEQASNELNKQCVVSMGGAAVASCTEIQSAARALRTPTDFDVVNIFTNISVLPDIERQLQLLYRPFTCFVSTKCVYDLSELCFFIANATYEPDKHSALFVQRVKPVCTLTIYANGNVCCKGYSREGARDGLSKLEEVLEMAGYSPAFSHFRYNVVNATFCVPFQLDLEWMIQESYHNVISNNDQPFIFHIMPKTKIKFAIFPTGFVYVLGCKLPNETKDAIAFIMPILYRFKAERHGSPHDLQLSLGDISSRLLWEREFQKQEDFSISW